MGGRVLRAGCAAIVLGCVAAALVGAPRPASAAAGFRDVPPRAYYTAAVQWAADRGVTTGVGGSDRFEPERSVRRGEAVTMIWRAHERPAGAAPRFADQVAGSYYDRALLWGRDRVTTGVGGSDRFEPERAVTRGEAITMIWRSYGSPAGDAPRFADQVAGSYYDRAVRWGRGRVTTGIGRSDLFGPNRPVSRAELVTFLYRAAGSPQVSIDPLPPYVPGPLVHLTFDDGPDPRWTPGVLDALRRHGARATFFVVGDAVHRHPHLARRIVAEGHSIQNHTRSHARLTTLAAAGVRAELQQGDQAVVAATGVATTCFRPPYGATSPLVVDVAARLGLREVLWRLDTADYKRPPAATITFTVLSRVEPGDIVLFHDGGGDRSQTVASLETILPELQRRGYRFGLPCP